jgi:hypothetical protein
MMLKFGRREKMKKETPKKQVYTSYEAYEKAYYPNPSDEKIRDMEPRKVGEKIAEDAWKRAKHFLSRNK